MTLCARCGSSSPAGSAACVSCGNPLTTPAAGAPKGQFKQTMLGGAVPSAPAGRPALQKTQLSPTAPAATPAAGPPAAARPFGGTMLGGLGGAPMQSAQPLQGPPPTQPSTPGLGGTMAGGIVPPNDGPVAAPNAVPGPSFGGTMAGGLSPAAPTPAPAQAPHPGRALGGTMIGVAPGGFGPGQAAAPHGPGPTAPAAPPPIASPAGSPPAGFDPRIAHGHAVETPGGAPSPSFKSTMLAGGAAASPPSSTPGTAAAGSPSMGPLQGGAAGAASVPRTLGNQTMLQAGPMSAAPIAQAGAAGQPAHKRTVVGVAHPGIAPSSATPALNAPPAVAPVRVQVSDPRKAPRRAPQPSVPKGAWVLIAVASVLVVAGILFALVYEPPQPMSAKVAVTEEGAESVRLSCEDCPDGTAVDHDAARAEFRGGKAELRLAEDLPVGTSTLTVAVERPGMGRDEKIELPVFVAYRIRGDFSGISANPPELRVTVEAEPGASVLVDGKAVSLDSKGRGAHVLDVADELVGAKDVVVPLERRVPYSITTVSGENSRGEVTVRIGIAPLRIDAPGERIVIESEHFMLTGRTANDGVLTVSGRPITVDASGRFSQLMNVSSVGATKIVVRAIAEKHAPRTMTIHVKRVESLRDEAKVLRQRAKTSFADYADATAAEGSAVAVHGRVFDARVDGHSTVAVVEVSEGCDDAPCLAKVVHGAKLSIGKDDVVTAYGRVTGMVDGPRGSKKIPEVRAEFVLSE